jgi:hypothetical protein
MNATSLATVKSTCTRSNPTERNADVGERGAQWMSDVEGLKSQVGSWSRAGQLGVLRLRDNPEGLAFYKRALGFLRGVGGLTNANRRFKDAPND